MTTTQPALALRGMVKHFGSKVAVGGVDLDVPTGSFFGLVGPNGAGKTTLLSMATGLLRPDRGQVHVRGTDLWADPVAGKRQLGILPDGMKLFDRLSGAELIHYAGVLRGMDPTVVHERRAALLAALDLEAAANVLVVDYSAGMTKKIALATALVHAPPILVLDEPFEAVDPVSAGVIRQILRTFVGNGGTVVLSSHVMEVVESLCDHVAVMAEAQVRAAGPLEEVRAGQSLQDRFIELVGGGRDEVEGLEWLRT